LKKGTSSVPFLLFNFWEVSVMRINNELLDQIFDESDDNFIEEELKEPIKVELNKNPVSLSVYDWVNSIIIAVVTVVVLLTFCFRLINVDGTSMEPTLINSDKVIVTNLFYTPKNGDIVVISHAKHYNKPLVKRIIATEGQTLEIDFETSRVYVDGVLLDEPYTKGATEDHNIEIPTVIPEGKVFVMGDHRAVSMDSRHADIGLIDVDSIIGKAQFVVIPHSKESDTSAPMLDFTKFGYLY